MRNFKQALLFVVRRQSGAAMFEGAVVLLFTLALVLGGFELITIGRLASMAGSISKLAARTGAARLPLAASIPDESLLKISQAASYLPAWRNYAWIRYCNPPAGAVVPSNCATTVGIPSFDANTLLTLNLALGYASQIMSGYRTVAPPATPWSTTSAIPLMDKEFYLVPMHYGNCNLSSCGSNQARISPIYYTTCIGHKPLLGLFWGLSSLSICRSAKMARY